MVRDGAYILRAGSAQISKRLRAALRRGADRSAIATWIGMEFGDASGADSVPESAPL